MSNDEPRRQGFIRQAASFKLLHVPKPNDRLHDRAFAVPALLLPPAALNYRPGAMATDNTPVSPIRPEESVTTREEMDFDDNEHETGTVSPQGQETPTKPAKAPSPRPRVSFQEQTEEIPPSKPPRPVSPHQQAEITLIEAFPTIDTKVVKAVLAASGGKVEPAFNALLGMSDPDFRLEDAQPPPQPPRPAQRQPLNQLEADERLARQLAEQYNSGGQMARHQYNQREQGRRGPNQQRTYDDDDRERSFFDDDLPEIGRNIQEGFMETQKRVNSWITNFKKKIDGEENEEDLYNSSQAGSRQNTGNWPPRQDFGASQSEQLYQLRKAAEQQRRSTETQRYDADPRELGEEEFERLELRDEEARMYSLTMVKFSSMFQLTPTSTTTASSD